MELKGCAEIVTAAVSKVFIALAIACLVLAGGCTRMPPPKTSITPKTVAELQRHLLNHQAVLDEFRLRGPFAVTEHRNHAVQLSAREHINTDLFLSAPAEKAPLVIFVHGHDSSKEAHANQAAHLASWAMHSLTVQLPKNGPWAGNGKTLARLVNLIHRSPQVIDGRVDASRIVLVGHSFGAISVSVALADGAPAVGGVFLDPAAIGRDLPGYLQRVSKPVMILGADEEFSPTRNRHYFYRFIRSSVAEVSIRDALHEDAQYPSEFAVQHFGLDPNTTEALQITFVSALASAAFSLAATGTLDHAWSSFGAVLKDGKFFNARRK